nr:hypothetical protein [Pandoravirus massiliensis]
MPRPFGSVMSAGASILAGPRSRLSVIGLYRPCGDAPLVAHEECASPALWWPRDVAQWRAVSAAAARCLLRGGSTDNTGDASSLGVLSSSPAMCDTMDRHTTLAGARLVGLVVGTATIAPCSDTAKQTIARHVQAADGTRSVHIDALHDASQEWAAFCRLVALRDAVLWRALDVDPSAYGERGAHIVASILRTEEAIARRRRFDAALADADEISALRRAFVAVADAHRSGARTLRLSVREEKGEEN